MNAEQLRNKIITDLWEIPNHQRFFTTGISQALRTFIENCVPEVEIVKEGQTEIIRLKNV